jgi:hypothetical protein
MEVRRAYQLEVIVRDKPGVLGQVLQSLAMEGADLRGICTYNQGDNGVIQLIPHDPGRAEAALRTAGYPATRKEVVVVEGEDKPGIVADLGRRLGRAGVNIEFLYATGTPGGEFLAAFQTADISAAFDVLKE